MEALHIALVVLSVALRLYIFVLFLRALLDLVMVVHPGFRPRGVVLVFAEIVFTITDPPIKFFRRILPPFRLGLVSIDLSWTATFFCCVIISWLLPV